MFNLINRIRYKCGWIQTGKTGGQSNKDTSPYKVSVYSLHVHLVPQIQNKIFPKLKNPSKKFLQYYSMDHFKQTEPKHARTYILLQ